MLVYGTKATAIKSEPIPQVCKNCQTANLRMTIFQRYAHVFWIPFFPVNKTAITECSHCKQVLTKKEFSPELKQEYSEQKTGTKPPIWTFVGLVGFAALMVWAGMSVEQNKKNSAKWILAPQKGDVYEIKTEDGEYSICKVNSIAGDTVFLFYSQFQINKSSKLYQIKNKGEEAYLPLPIPKLKSELKTMLDKGEIMEVERDSK